MTAKDEIVRNKTTLVDILAEDPQLIINTVEQKNLITHREKRILTNVNKGSDDDQSCGLVDKIIGKGEQTCKAFLDLLKTDDVIKNTFTRLEEEIQWDDNTGGPADNNGQEEVCDDQYLLTSEPTGLCVIMNNEKFKRLQPRAGTNQDAVDLARTFSWLGFRVLMFKDLTKGQMEETLGQLSSLTNLMEPKKHGVVREWYGDEFTDFDPHRPLQHGDAFVCCVMSHGDKGCVSGIDGETLRIGDITKPFNGVKCPVLDGKPKVFFIEACQTEREDQPGGQADNSAELDHPSRMVVTAEADFLVAMSTVENYKANRHTINGSWFMQCLWKQLKKLCPGGLDLMTILCRVNDEVAQKGAQMPGLRNVTLRKKLVFKPVSD